MLQAAVACVSGWLTPAVLFLLLNLVIGTIAVASKSGGDTPSSASNAAGSPKHPLSRSPSIVLDRLRSFNLYSYRPPKPPDADTISVPQPETLQCDPQPETEPEPEEAEPHHIARSQSDTKPEAGEIPTKLAKKMKKSATMKSAFNHFEFEAEEEIETPKRPATMRERGREDDAGVDAKADDFINRFRQQLKLQRLDSIIRWEILTYIGRSSARVVRALVGWQILQIGITSLMRLTRGLYFQPQYIWTQRKLSLRHLMSQTWSSPIRRV